MAVGFFFICTVRAMDMNDTSYCVERCALNKKKIFFTYIRTIKGVKNCIDLN